MSPSDLQIKAKTGETHTDIAGNEHHDGKQETLESTTLPSLRLPLVSLSSGLKNKASPYMLQPWAALSMTLDGRDNITKIFQYASRLLVFWFARLGCTTEAQRFNALQSNLTLSRKAFRLGRSLTEIEKLRKMSAFALIMWHIRRASKAVSPKENEQSPPPAPLWKTLGSALKIVGLIGFWAGDNVSFLASTGVFDDFSLAGPERASKRDAMQTRAASFANRTYLFGSFAGLFVAAKSYWLQRVMDLRMAKEQLRTTESNDTCRLEAATKLLEKTEKEQFSLFLSLLKSTCDVIVFSNNTGTDLFTKMRGKRNHEVLHCLCGILSACTVLYNNFPDS